MEEEEDGKMMKGVKVASAKRIERDGSSGQIDKAHTIQGSSPSQCDEKLDDAGAGDGWSLAATPIPLLLQLAAFLPWPDTDKLPSPSMSSCYVVWSEDDHGLGDAARGRKRDKNEATSLKGMMN
uniref:DUF834 domain-containing protein n=1 Tax=Oryza rufipogon TaxID=4529 RepID=A0A0E0MVK8_ORYRU